MADRSRANILTVPVGLDIASSIAGELVRRQKRDPLALSDMLLLLPNNRAVSALTAAFVRHSDAGLILPRMAAIGDLALDEALGPLLDPLGEAGVEPVPPAIEEGERLLLLTRLVRRRRPGVTAAEAINLARLLAQTLDQLEVEEIPVERIGTDHGEHDLADHWQRAYGDLLQLAADYREKLAELGLLNPAGRRNCLLDRLAERLGRDEGRSEVWAIGIATAAPAIARLLRQIAFMPQGRVILPAVDLAMDAEAWDQLGDCEPGNASSPQMPGQETHPQFHLKLLLHRMGVRREEITTLGSETRQMQRIGGAVADIFCPAAQTVEWQQLPSARKSLSHLRLLECADSVEEARAIAVLAREALETPGRRVAILTADRELAQRVAAQLRRWAIEADDSAGQPLLHAPPGVLLLACARLLAGKFDPVALLAAFKHPLVAAGDARLAWLEHVRQLDFALRGPRQGLGLAGIDAAVRAMFGDPEKHAGVRNWWAETETRLRPFDLGKMPRFGDVLAKVAGLADDLSEGAIWKGPAGRALSDFLAELRDRDLAILDDAPASAFPALLADLAAGKSIRPLFGAHPRIAIYGLLEARMQSADLVICAGLNEGSWPQLPQPDPWLAPRLRRDLGLPGLERNIGLSAHDLATALGGPEVVLTRADRDRSGPTIASRFVLRIQAFLGSALHRETRALMLATALDAAPRRSAVYPRPAPVPSKAQRRVDISITQMDVLKADPFAFYARNILRLRPLLSVGAEPDAAWKGSAVHAILQRWAEEGGNDPDRLIALAREMLENPALHPSLRTLWQPRISAALGWVAETTRQAIAEGRRIAVTEQKGQVEIDDILIHGRVDRIDRRDDGRVVIVDYKTGTPPQKKRVRAGFALQLGLSGLMVETGGVEGVAGEVAGYEYWSLAKAKGGDAGFGYVAAPFAKTVKAGEPSAENFAAFAESEARGAIARWIHGGDPFTAKLKPEFAPYRDYDQLMRLAEWMGNTDWPEDFDAD